MHVRTRISTLKSRAGLPRLPLPIAVVKK